MNLCDQPDCSGTVEETGFCDTCGLPPRASPISGSTTAPTSSALVTRLTQISGGSELLSLPVFDFPDPSSRILSNPQVPERERTCVRCGADVGRSYAGQPPLNRGYCGRCGHPYSFLPSLREGDLVAGQYKVIGCFARGGLGWVYLARDTKLDDNLVVLKGLIDVGDTALAAAERQALTMMDHPNVVRIFNFASHPDAHTHEPRDYIVMEYVDGLVLSDVKRQCAAGGQPLGEPLLVEHVIVCGLQILAAFEYLHRRQLLYCDMKPDNVIVRSGQHGERVNRVKLIDLGAVRKIGDRVSPVISTVGFEVDRAEMDERGLTVESDIHALGVTLDEMFRVTVDWSERQDATSAVATGLESFGRLISRATHRDADRRFASASEMIDQLTGVYREIASLRTGIERPVPSTVFAPAATLLDAGLGTVPPLDRWLHDDRHAPRTGSRPEPPAAVASLPQPLVDPEDPAAGFLAAADTADPRRLLDKLSAHIPDSVEAELARCRAQLALGEVGAAAESVRRAARLGGVSATHDWRMSWHEGLLALGRGAHDAAGRAFDAVYGALPGEPAPKLALGYCAEAGGQLARAEQLYRAVWSRDRLQASAAFGLARIYLAGGDQAGALAVLTELELSKVSRHADAAAVAGVIILCGPLSSGPPTAADLAAAAERLPGVYLDGGEDSGDARDRLTALVREAALGWVRTQRRPLPVDGGPVFGRQPDEVALRRLLERSYRALAWQARDADTHGRLLDRANAIRPTTLL